MQNIELHDPFGNPVQAIVSIPEKAESIAILSHGFTSNKNSKLYLDLEVTLNDKRIGTVRYDYFGHGPAYGHKQGYAVSDNTTLSKASESLRTVVGFLRTKGRYNLGLLGSSFGGLVSLVVASQDSDIKALVLKSSVTEPIRFWRERLGNEKIEQWRKEGVVRVTQDVVDYDLGFEYWEDLQGYDTLAMARDISCPVLIIHGEKDTCVPISQSYKLAKILGADVNVIEGADHSYSDPGQYERTKSIMLDFLVKNLSH